MGLWLSFGVLRRPHGTKGEILLAPYGEDPGSLVQQPCPMAVRVQAAGSDAGGAQTMELAACRPVHGGLLVRFSGLDDREKVAALVGHEVQVPRQALAPLGPGEFYVDDVVGCEVVSVRGERFGRVRGVFWNGAQNVMAIAAEDGGERFVPVVAQLICAFDPSVGRITVDFDEQ